MVNQACETCQNPFFTCRSQNPTRITLDIIHKGELLHICEDCWTKLAESDIEWHSEATYITPSLKDPE